MTFFLFKAFRRGQSLFNSPILSPFYLPRLEFKHNFSCAVWVAVPTQIKMLALNLDNFFVLASLLCLLLLLHVVQSYLRNPLRKIPAAHPLSHFASLWIYSIRWREIENQALKTAHDKFGPIVCLGPQEISINCIQGGLREVYAGGFDKVSCKDGYNWYSFFANFDGYVCSI